MYKLLKSIDPYDEPNKPGTPEVTDYDNQSVSLKWTAPNNDGGAPIEKYIIEKKDKNKPDWEKAIEVPGNQLEATVAGLQEYGEYQFRVVAVNKAGPSAPSDASKMQIVKYKKREYIFWSQLFFFNNVIHYLQLSPALTAQILSHCLSVLENLLNMMLMCAVNLLPLSHGTRTTKS